jgi:transcriptional regulator of acetoin/glycerol metabolism
MERMMESPGPLIVTPDVRAHQTGELLAMAEGSLANIVPDEVSNSWLRCTKEHRVDPYCKAAPQILTAGEIIVHREPLENLISTARGEMIISMRWFALPATLYCFAIRAAP